MLEEVADPSKRQWCYSRLLQRKQDQNDDKTIEAELRVTRIHIYEMKMK